MKLTQFSLPLILFSLSGCGSDSSSGGDQGLNRYANDQMVIVNTGAVSPSIGQNYSYQDEEVKTYIEVSAIPDKYSYSGNISGPFKLEVTTQDGVIEGHEYSSSTGIEIIDDNFEEFESMDFTVRQGNDTPDDIQFGESYNYYKNATLFDSTTGQEVGYRITEMTFEFISLESITVLAGTFDAVKINVDMIYEVGKGAEQQLADMSGSMWLDTKYGYSLRSTMEGTFNYPHLSASADALISTELKFVYIEEDESDEVKAKARGRSSSFTSINLNLKNIANEVVSSFYQ